MKKLIALALSLALALTLCVCGMSAEETPANGPEMVLGTLTLLNMTEEEYLAKVKGKSIALQYLTEQGVFHSSTPSEDILDSTVEPKIVFYDTLDAMLMALDAGDIDSAEVPQCTADYLCAHIDNLTVRGSFDLEGADDFAKRVTYRMGVGYSFLTTEDRTDLRDALDQAITAMKEDGTLDALIQTYITDAIDDEPEPAAFTQTDGETLRVAITGVIPPMDYISADGTPAGFNTAFLAELGRRMNVNFELVQVDSVGRAAALSSGNVDFVFWTNGTDGRATGGRLTREQHEDVIKNKVPEDHNELMHAISGGIDYVKEQSKDIPDGTISTQSYYNDLLVPVTLK
ncbi:MAG: transporter substrate-binding domain-containing protein [Clostridia bacterium]|nr:transporter substrate-binding domain-containing protein [Clostridia bacterium]